MQMDVVKFRMVDASTITSDIVVELWNNGKGI